MLPRLLALVAAGSSLIFVACNRGEGGDEPSRPNRVNLLVVTVSRLDARAFDDTWREDLRAPSLDALRSRGIAFSNANALSLGTDAELATIFTGLHPRHHRSYASIYDLGEQQSTPAAKLRRIGFTTGGFTVGTPTSEQPGFREGFDVFKAPTADESIAYARPNGDVLDAALDWLREREDESAAPWFCWIHVGLPNVLEDGTPLSEELASRRGLVALDEDLAELVAFVEAHAPGGARQMSGSVVTAMTALRGAPGAERLPVPLRGFRVPLLFSCTEWQERKTIERAATLADVGPALFSLLPGGSWVTRDSAPIFSDAPEEERLIVLDRIELGEPTATALRLGDATVGVSGIFDGLAFAGDDLALDATSEQIERARDAYSAWSDLGSDADQGRRFELEREWLQKAKAWMREHHPELFTQGR